MRFFDALKRKKTYVNAGNQEFVLKLASKDYLDTEIEDRYSLVNDWVKNQKFDDAFAVTLRIEVTDKGEDILDDEEVFDLMSNVAAAFARTFKEQKQHVLSPSEHFMESLPITPVTILLLTTTYIVDKPFQIVVARSHPETDSYEEVTLI